MIKVGPFHIIFLGCAIFFLLLPSVSAIDIIAPTTLYDPGYYRLINDVTNCTTNCIEIQGSGITLDGNGHTISGLNGNSASGVGVNGGTGCIVKNLKIANFDYGIKTGGTKNLSIQNCLIKNCSTTGVDSGGSSYSTTIEDSTIENNTLWGLEFDDGRLFNGDFYGASNHTILRNTVRNNNVGISIWSGTDNLIKDNKIINNLQGIRIAASHGNLIYNNYFFNPINVGYARDPNIWNVQKSYGLNILNNPYLGGNYWGQPDGQGISQISPDSNNDGICDAAYIINSGNIDYLPLKAGVIIPPTTIPTTKPTPTPSPKPTTTPSPTFTSTPTPTVTSTQTPSPTPTPTPSPTVTPTPTPTPNPSGPLKANFNANPKTGATPLLVSFQDLSTGIPTSWSWAFGDGTTSTDQNPTHTYSQAGIFSVKLKVSDPLGSNGLSRSGYIIVSTGTAPTPTVTPTPTPTPPPSNPIIVIDQSMTSITQAVDTTASYSPFSVTNQGGAALTYTINEQASWLSISSGASGTVSPNGKSQVGVLVDTHGLSKGHSYWAVFTVANNDPLQDTIPLLFRVTVS